MADILGLQSMIETAEKAAEEREERTAGNAAAKSKTAIVTAPTSLDAPAGGGETKEAGSGGAGKDIWDAAALPTEEDDDDPAEGAGRKRPEYDILYKQDVGTEDVFLGLSDVDPSSNSCNFIVVKIKFPGEKLRDIDLDVTQTRIKAQSPTHFLSTYLPYPVKHKDGSAKFDARNSTLVVTLPIIREDW
uniref:PIH1D1/2/3 CS-like domain-containing protein n=1 Tax=Bicosoecida sp. CB-2014 TaxID=1486930 RepID=A0A7S1GDH3_9STRA|mmetsp:Transcript_7136/g.25432  ORF Transcript_7136/g.25432 Transcript_7136/m.25432 type:complete len:189 (+) Transcript_7136:216-782(+)|eukprot:CAMPEP_0203815560 /NCGR_PEP_ID=MMETSP0115-20131106/11178_1 /ASSEMBLY_ACC=CAM_ASM_000227 /TAXON_ID=33651 /ORGANISM="Bicosoecid sp, Strain ms1" /LENGTH=188 /DNA_ID=CAMNT_0050724457 /DNA_START=215 /DNA_END=781 /DNA_ORIENTATION=+